MPAGNLPNGFALPSILNFLSEDASEISEDTNAGLRQDDIRMALFNASWLSLGIVIWIAIYYLAPLGTDTQNYPSESKDMPGNTADTHHVQGTSQNLRRRALQNYPSESKDMSGNTADTHHVQGTSQNLRRRALQNYPSESKDMSGNTADTHHVRSASQSPRLKK